jgi:hypothetical protein
MEFEDYVSLITYGDDYAGSVSNKIDFNNHHFVAWAERYDMVVTNPCKDADVETFYNCDELDFLKRRPRYDDELCHYMGILDETSIFKSLHCNMRSKTETKEDVACSTMSSALSEWFLYGRDTYEMRRAQLKEVAERTGLRGLVHGIDIDYDARCEQWRNKYNVF